MDHVEGVPDGRDRRLTPRRRVLKGIQIVSPDKQTTIDCTLKSISRHGALISCQSMVDIPDRFYIRSAAQPGLVPCQVVRRNLTSVAVAFQGEPGRLVEGL